MIKTYFYEDSERKIYPDVDLGRKDEYLASPENLLWVDVFNCDDLELNYIGKVFDFHPLAIEDCLQLSPRAKVDKYDGYFFFVFHALHYDEEGEDEITTSELDVFLGQNYIVTIHKRPLAAVGKVVKQCLKHHALMDRGPDYLIYSIVDAIVDDYFPIIDRIGERIDELEDELYINPAQEITDEILSLKRTTLLLRKVVLPQRRIFASVGGRYSFTVRPENQPFYMDLADHLERIIDATDTYRDLVNNALDSFFSVLSGRTNEVIRVLTIISTIMMPLTFITGLFGMNVPLPLPEHVSSFWVIVLGSGIISAGMLWFFTKKLWI
ncbi:MAG: magnesium/cobalt transporter CorA [Bacillota bacterium]|jgi:magnesium transporter